MAAFEDLKQESEIEEGVAVDQYVECVADAVVSTIPNEVAVPERRWEVVVLRHGNERMSQAAVAQGVLQAGSAALGEMPPDYRSTRQASVGGLGIGAQYGVLLPFSRKHESEADELGQRFIAKAGFNPAAAVVVWQKMDRLSQGQPPEFLSTHPSRGTRIDDLREHLPETLDLHRAARASGRNPQCTPP